MQDLSGLYCLGNMNNVTWPSIQAANLAVSRVKKNIGVDLTARLTVPIWKPGTCRVEYDTDSKDILAAY